MNHPIILDCSDSKSVFRQKLVKNEYDLFVTATIPEKRRYIKKFFKNNPNQTIVLKNQYEQERIFIGNTILHNEITYESVVVIICELCKQVAKRSLLQIPYDEIYLIASSEIAYSLVVPLMSICKLFTVVSDEYDVKKADEMYFKYGCIIRHKQKTDEISGNNKIVLCADEKMNCRNIKIPIINLTSKEYNEQNIVNIHDIKVSDSRISPIVKHWKGEPGLRFYNLFGIIPDEKSDIDINIKSDKIFLLDISKF